VNPVWLLKQKNLVDVFEQNLVVVRFTVQFGESTIKIKGVISSWDHHRQVLDAGDDCPSELPDVSFLVDFVVKDLGCSHLFVVFLFAVSLLLTVCILFSHIRIKLIVGHVESHFTQDVPLGLF